MRRGRLLAAPIGRLSQVIVARAGGIDLDVEIRRLPGGNLTEHALGGRTAADVPQADE